MAPPQSCWIQVLSPGVRGYPGLSHGRLLLTTCCCPAPQSRHAGQVNARGDLSSAQSQESWATSTCCPAVPRTCRAALLCVAAEVLVQPVQQCQVSSWKTVLSSRRRQWPQAEGLGGSASSWPACPGRGVGLRLEVVSAGGSTGPPSTPVRQGRGGLGGVCDQIPVSTLAIWVPRVSPPGPLCPSLSQWPWPEVWPGLCLLTPCG